jgi:hypothetical protein
MGIVEALMWRARRRSLVLAGVCASHVVAFASQAHAQAEASDAAGTAAVASDVHMEAMAHLVLSVPLSVEDELWAGFDITVQGTWTTLPVSMGIACVILPLSTATSNQSVILRRSDGTLHEVAAERRDAAMSLDAYIKAHLPLDFAFSPFLEASFGPRVTQTRHTLESDDGESEIELDSQTNWNLEYNLGGGLAWFYDKKQRWQGSVVSLGAQYGATIGKSKATVGLGNEQVRYQLPNAALRIMLGWGQRF